MKEQLLIVTVPVANVRKEPLEASSSYVCDDLQETQVLYNEILLCRDEDKDWYILKQRSRKKQPLRVTGRGIRMDTKSICHTRC